jgi:hypothetical protein
MKHISQALDEALSKMLKKKRCKVCREEYQPTKPMQRVCGYDCALSLAQSERAKAEKRAAVKDRRETREKLKTRAQWLKEAQAAFNGWVRARDAELPCVSCGRHHDGQWHAGHYLSTGARPELRFEPLNVWKQCAPCNTHLSGNLVLYRAELIRRIGLEKVEWLEGPHEPCKWTVDELKEIKARYARMAKELKT